MYICMYVCMNVWTDGCMDVIIMPFFSLILKMYANN